jgi:hypothetical protein
VLCGKADLSSVLKLVGGPKGTPADRLRLSVIWLLAYDGEFSDSRLCQQLCRQMCIGHVCL